MKKIIIEFGEKDFAVKTEGDVEDMEFMNVLAEAIIAEGKFMSENHECDEPECCMKIISKELSDAVETTIKLHNITHHHDRKYTK